MLGAEDLNESFARCHRLTNHVIPCRLAPPSTPPSLQLYTTSYCAEHVLPYIGTAPTTPPTDKYHGSGQPWLRKNDKTQPPVRIVVTLFKLDYGKVFRRVPPLSPPQSHTHPFLCCCFDFPTPSCANHACKAGGERGGGGGVCFL